MTLCINTVIYQTKEVRCSVLVRDAQSQGHMLAGTEDKGSDARSSALNGCEHAPVRVRACL